jgi:hypothetical protein
MGMSLELNEPDTCGICSRIDFRYDVNSCIINLKRTIMKKEGGAIEIMVGIEEANLYKQAVDALGIHVDIVDAGGRYTKQNILVQHGEKGVSIFTTRQVNSRKFWNKVKEIEGTPSC